MLLATIDSCARAHTFHAQTVADAPPLIDSMSNVAFIFPGQGSQSVGMGRDIAATSPAAAAVFAAADDALGESLTRWHGTAPTSS